MRTGLASCLERARRVASTHIMAVEQSGGGRRAPTEDLNNPQFWDRVGPALFQSIRAAASLSRPVAPADMRGVPWPRFSGSVREFSSFQREWEKVKKSRRPPPGDSEECAIFCERAVDKDLGHRLLRCTTMEQVWEIMEVTYALPERALVRNERAIMEHRAVPGGDRMSARERCADLAGRTREAMSYGVLSLWATAENFKTCHSKLEELDKGAWDAVGRRQLPVQAPREFFR